MNTLACKLRDVSYTYPGEQDPSIHHISLDVQQGEFVLIIGESGSGKSTLIRTLNRLIPDFHGGTLAGTIEIQGKNVRHWSHGALTEEVGFVFQDPERQMVMTDVEQELAFGLENIGVPSSQIVRRVQEVLSFFGLSHLRNRQTASLSGGEKQRLAIASVMALQPNVLILDEPTSQLDPTAAEEVLHVIDLLHRELGVTVIMVEQRLDRCLQVASRVIAMDEGQIAFDGSIHEYASWAWLHEKRALVPYVAKPFLGKSRWYPSDSLAGKIPVSVAEAKMQLSSIPIGAWTLASGSEQQTTIPNGANSITWKTIASKWFTRKGQKQAEGTPLLAVSNLVVGMPTVDSGREGSDKHDRRHPLLKDIDLQVKGGEIVAIIGPNGAGKSTLLRSIVRLQPQLKGSVTMQGVNTTRVKPEEMAGWIGYLSQNPGDYLFQETLLEECRFSLETALPYHRKRGTAAWSDSHVENLLKRMDLWNYRDQNPRDLSGGERQRAAIAAVWVQNPTLLLLDEPTRGLDQGMKEQLGELLREFVSEGRAVVLVTHDLDFAANISNQIVFLMGGKVLAGGTPKDVLSQGMFYTTQTHRAFKQWDPLIVGADEASILLQQMEEFA